MRKPDRWRFYFLIRIIMALLNPNNPKDRTWDVNTNTKKWLSGIQKVLIAWLVVTWLAAASQLDEGIKKQTREALKVINIVDFEQEYGEWMNLNKPDKDVSGPSNIAIEDTETNYANQTTKEAETSTTPTVVANPTVETVKPQKTWKYNDKEYTAKELEAAMKNNEELEDAFMIAKMQNPELDVRFTDGTNQLAIVTAQANKAKEEANKAKEEANKAKEEANKAKEEANAVKKAGQTIKAIIKNSNE